MKRRSLLLTGAALPLAAPARARPPRWPYATLGGAVPLVIAHRGASGELPEHTLAAYARAIDQGADYIEPDLVCTRDGGLLARHDNELSLTTDVASRPQFARRQRTQHVDGRPASGWFVEDFTLAEMQQLRARERWPELRPSSAAHDGRHAVPTLGQIIELVQRMQAGRGRRIGLYPETKHAAHFAALNLALEPVLVRELEAAGYRSETDPVFIQSFEPGSLKRLAGLTPLPLVQLVAERGTPADLAARGETGSFADLVSPAGMLEVATYADAIGVAKGLVIPRDGSGRLALPTGLVERAHAAGLAVHAWTFRDEDRFLPTGLEGRPGAEIDRFLAAGIDGVFTDFPATGVAAIRRWRQES